MFFETNFLKIPFCVSSKYLCITKWYSFSLSLCDEPHNSVWTAGNVVTHMRLYSLLLNRPLFMQVIKRALNKSRVLHMPPLSRRCDAPASITHYDGHAKAIRPFQNNGSSSTRSVHVQSFLQGLMRLVDSACLRISRLSLRNCTFTMWVYIWIHSIYPFFMDHGGSNTMKKWWFYGWFIYRKITILWQFSEEIKSSWIMYLLVLSYFQFDVLMIVPYRNWKKNPKQ